MDTVTAIIDQQFLNDVLGKIKVSGEKEFEKEFDIPLLPDPSLKVKASFLISKLRAETEEGLLNVFAKVNVRMPTPLPLSKRPFSYTEEVQAAIETSMEGSDVRLRVTSLVVPIYLKVGGYRLEFGDFDVCRLLSRPLEKSVSALPKPYVKQLPLLLGGATVTVGIVDPALAVHSGFLEASASLVAS